MQHLSYLLAVAVTAATATTLADDGKNLDVELRPRTPGQIASFYEARGFPTAMIDILKQQCFITVRIHNRRDDIVWLELANWEFEVDGKPLQRFHRDEFKQRWQAMGIPLGSQSTFRWTLLPETLDFLPDEKEGGNIILPRTAGAIHLKARFATGEDKQGPEISTTYESLKCAID